MLDDLLRCQPHEILQDQLLHCASEFAEFSIAHDTWQKMLKQKTDDTRALGKARAAVLEEALDTINCIKTYLHEEFSDQEMAGAVQLINSKCYIRGYLCPGENKKFEAVIKNDKD